MSFQILEVYPVMEIINKMMYSLWLYLIFVPSISGWDSPAKENSMLNRVHVQDFTVFVTEHNF